MVYEILCVDPDETVRERTVTLLRNELTDLDPRIKTATGVADAVKVATKDTDAVITEYELSDGTGIALIERIKEQAPDAGFLLYTSADPDTIDTAKIEGKMIEYVGKGSAFGTDRLAELLRKTIADRTQGTYPVPQNETERIASLQAYDLDDEPLIASLDRITDIAATHFAVERASVNIITEHSQDFLACHGKANDWDSMNREDSICTFTIVEEGDVMTVEDVTEDPRFESRSESLLDMGIRSYMGATLRSTAGIAIGTLCIYDDVSRSFSDPDKTFLQNLSAIAMDLIELHAAKEDSQ